MTAFSIKTERLRLVPLNLQQLRLLQQNRGAMEADLGLLPSEMQTEAVTEREIAEAMNFWLLGVEKDPVNYPWHTTWEIVLAAENRSIGSVGLSGLPDENGETAVGYSIDLRCHGKGYMTEALTALVGWAFQNQELKRILAETHHSNIASHRVLEKCGFSVIENPTEEGNLMWATQSFGV